MGYCGNWGNHPHFAMVSLDDSRCMRSSFVIVLREEPILSLGKFHRRGALLIVVRHAVDPRAHGIAPHQPSIVGALIASADPTPALL